MNKLNNLLTTKHQLKLLVQVLDEWIIPEYELRDVEKQQLMAASEIIGNVHEQLEFRLMDAMQHGH